MRYAHDFSGCYAQELGQNYKKSCIFRQIENRLTKMRMALSKKGKDVILWDRGPIRSKYCQNRGQKCHFSVKIRFEKLCYAQIFCSNRPEFCSLPTYGWTLSASNLNFNCGVFDRLALGGKFANLFFLSPSVATASPELKRAHEKRWYPTLSYSARYSGSPNTQNARLASRAYK